MATHDLRPRTRPLMALFAALLAGCTEREVPGESDGSTGAESSEASSDPGTGGPTTTSVPGTTDTPGTATGSGTDSATGTTDPTFPTETSTSECVYDDHLIVLTPEQYDAWLHGEGQASSTSDSTGDPGDTTTSDTTGDDTSGTDTTSDTTTDTSDTDTDSTTGEPMWTMELCLEICVALTGADEWDITKCEKLGENADGDIEIACKEIVEHCDGRSHVCIGSHGALAGPDPVAAYFARAAHDEAASVYAFAALAEELQALGAPTELIARVQIAAADEVRHAQAVARLAADRGGHCRAPERRPFVARGARQIAVENAVEGCVRETWAALIAAHQAEHAEDPQVRAVMRVIAVDEARHAELAWAIDAWLQTTLDLAGQAEVATARAAAVAAVLAGVTTREPALALVRAAGVPGRPQATRLCRGLAAALWAA